MKQLHAKCISCDRPLNVVRHKLGDLPLQDTATPSRARPHGPGWEALPNRAAGCGETEVALKLRCGRSVTGLLRCR